MNDQDVREIRAQLRQLQRRLRRESLPLPGISRTALQVLRAVDRLPAGTQPRHVAQELAMTSSNVAAALRELDSGGLVSRQRDPGDARRVRLSVTERGGALLRDLRSERDTWFGRAVEALLTEQEQTQVLAAGRLLARVAGYQSEADEPATGGPTTGGPTTDGPTTDGPAADGPA